MALGFATRTTRDRDITRGGKKVAYTRITLDNSYPTGGWAVTKAQLGLESTVDFVVIGNGNGFDLEFDYTNNKIKAFSASGTELANASAALNNVVVRLKAEGY